MDAIDTSRRFQDAGGCRVRVQVGVDTPEKAEAAMDAIDTSRRFDRGHCAPSRSRLRYVGVAVDTAEEAETA